MEWITIVWVAVRGLPPVTQFAVLVSLAVALGLLATATRAGALDLRDIVRDFWRRHFGRYLTERPTRLSVPNDRRPWWRGAA